MEFAHRIAIKMLSTFLNIFCFLVYLTFVAKDFADDDFYLTF